MVVFSHTAAVRKAVTQKNEVPLQFMRSVASVYPGKQSQKKLPGVFLHLAFIQIPRNSRHSSISRKKIELYVTVFDTCRFYGIINS